MCPCRAFSTATCWTCSHRNFTLSGEILRGVGLWGLRTRLRTQLRLISWLWGVRARWRPWTLMVRLIAWLRGLRMIVAERGRVASVGRLRIAEGWGVWARRGCVLSWWRWAGRCWRFACRVKLRSDVHVRVVGRAGGVRRGEVEGCRGRRSVSF